MMIMMCRQTTTMIMMMMNLKMYPGKMKITTMIMEMITGGAGKIQEAVIHAGDLVQLDGKVHASQVARVDWNLEEAKGEEMKMINILLHDMKGEMGVALPVVVVAKLPIEIPVGTAEAFLPVIKAQATGVLRQVAAMRVLQIIAVAVIPEGHRGIHHALSSAIRRDLAPGRRQRAGRGRNTAEGPQPQAGHAFPLGRTEDAEWTHPGTSGRHSGARYDRQNRRSPDRDRSNTRSRGALRPHLSA